jgi:hypothetical protein
MHALPRREAPTCPPPGPRPDDPRHRRPFGRTDHPLVADRQQQSGGGAVAVDHTAEDGRKPPRKATGGQPIWRTVVTTKCATAGSASNTRPLRATTWTPAVSASATRLSLLQRSGHRVSVTPSGVKGPRASTTRRNHICAAISARRTGADDSLGPAGNAALIPLARLHSYSRRWRSSFRFGDEARVALRAGRVPTDPLSSRLR